VLLLRQKILPGFCNTGNYNTAVGTVAMLCNQSGSNNVAVGCGALEQNTTACDNVAIGVDSLRFNTTGKSNTAVGTVALKNNTTGSNNVALGLGALCCNTSGDSTIGIGFNAGKSNTTGTNGIFIGQAAGSNNTTGICNIAVGRDAMLDNVAGIRNTVVGHRAGANLTGNDNTLLGFEAGYNFSSVEHSTMIGRCAGREATGTNNTFIGGDAGKSMSGKSMSTGACNTIVGRFTGNQCGLDIRTNDNNIVLSDGAGCPRFGIDCLGRISTALCDYGFGSALIYQQVCFRGSITCCGSVQISDSNTNNTMGVIMIETQSDGRAYYPYWIAGGGGLSWDFSLFDPRTQSFIGNGGTVRNSGSNSVCYCITFNGATSVVNVTKLNTACSYDVGLYAARRS